MIRSTVAVACLIAVCTRGSLAVAQQVTHRSPAESPGAASLATGVALYHHLAAQEGNVVLSPVSVSTALAMTYAGAAGDTATELATALHFGTDAAALHQAYGRQLARWNAHHADYTLRVVNRLWGEQSRSFLPTFLGLTRSAYGAELQTLDFRGHAEAARSTINQWVSARTEGHIPELLAPRQVDEDTRMVLTNAVFFHGSWEHPFAPGDTHAEAFRAPHGTTVRVPTMHTTETFSTGAGNGVHILELPYRGGDVALDVILPDTPDGLGAVESGLTPARLHRWFHDLQPRLVDVALPRWTSDSSLNLVPALNTLGIHRAFDAQEADFSGMAELNPDARLHIARVVHAAQVQVNEEGTVAAAATAVVMAESPAAPPVPVVFHADHPFLYVIRDTRSGAVLFIGRVVRP